MRAEEGDRTRLRYITNSQYVGKNPPISSHYLTPVLYLFSLILRKRDVEICIQIVTCMEIIPQIVSWQERGEL